MGCHAHVAVHELTRSKPVGGLNKSTSSLKTIAIFGAA